MSHSQLKAMRVFSKNFCWLCSVLVDYASTHLRFHLIIERRSRGELRLMEEQLKVLKVMSEVTRRVDMNTFAQMVGLNTSQTVQRMQDLVNSGFIKKVGGGYGITEKGQIILKAIKPLPKENAFHFYTGLGQPTGFSAESLKDFYEIVKRVAPESLDFHLCRGDFENWIKAASKDIILAEELANLKVEALKGEELRQRILKAIAARYGF